MQKQDLPDDFPFQMLHKGFAVLEIRIRNNSEKEWDFKLDDIQVFSKKGKKIERALPTDITPKIVEIYTRTARGIHSEGYIGGRPTRAQMSRVPTVQTAPSARTVSASIGGDLRSLVESFEIKDHSIAPDEEISGFYYLKSKKSGNDLTGGRLSIGSLKTSF